MSKDINDKTENGNGKTTQQNANPFASMATMQLWSMSAETLLKAADAAGVKVELGQMGEMLKMNIIQSIAPEDAEKISDVGAYIEAGIPMQMVSMMSGKAPTMPSFDPNSMQKVMQIQMQRNMMKQMMGGAASGGGSSSGGFDMQKMMQQQMQMQMMSQMMGGKSGGGFNPMAMMGGMNPMSMMGGFNPMSMMGMFGGGAASGGPKL